MNKPEIGQEYWSVFTDNGKRKVRRHVWENHPVDVLHLSQNNVFATAEDGLEYIAKTSYTIQK